MNILRFYSRIRKKKKFLHSLKADEEFFGRGGVLPPLRNILRELLAKPAKHDATFDNINKVSSEASDSTKDLRALRNERDETVTAIGNLANETDRMK
jgi:hypothetical protein